MTSLLGRLAPSRTARLNLLVDLALLLMALLFAALTAGPVQSPVELAWFGTAECFVWIFVSTALRHYDAWATDREAHDDAALVSVLVMAVTTILGVATFFAPPTTALPSVGYFLLFFWPSALLLRLALFRPLSRGDGPMDEVLIIGVGPLGRLTGEDLQNRTRRHVLGFLRFDDEGKPEPLRNRVLGTSADLEALLKTLPVSEVFISGNALKNAAEMQQAIKTCERFGVPFALPAYCFRLDRARPVQPHAVADGYIHYMSVSAKPGQMALKRLFDIVSASVALWMLLPLFAFVAAAIKLTSRGPIFFKQVRVGLHGKPFKMLKFRSMVVNAEELKAKLEVQNEQSGPVFKMKHDPRITAIGRFIRKYSIDELPQLINVLRGDMAVVGPRPPVPSEVAKYEAWQRRRLSVRPGLTCIWQVSGRNQISFEQWMFLDMQYIDHWSLAQDFNLILKTVPVVLTGRGAS
ncbi:MAG: sugar transferase [Myxococcaceae bacterium]